MKLTIPEKAAAIIGTIQDAGFEAYLVGGCVRDSILGREPGDWDITTSASPEQVKALFAKTVDTGLKHGTVTVMMGKEGFEVTTYRIDGSYEDGRHPNEVTFTRNLEEDLRRRDFTINAMAYNDRQGLVDLYGGLQDIEAGVIRCVGDAGERFSEDALRIMRALRFAAQLGYRIEEKTAEAIRRLAPTLSRISAERIRVELTKLLLSPHPEVLRDVYDMGVTKVVLPEFDVCMETPQNNPHHCYTVGEHTIRSIQNVAPLRELRLAMLFHDIGKPAAMTTDEQGISHFYQHPTVSEEMTREIMQRLRFDNDTIALVCRLVLYHDFANGTDPTPRLVRRAMNRIGEDIFDRLLEVNRADILAQSEYLREEKLARVEEWRRAAQEVRRKGQCVSAKTLAVTGKDLIELGIAPGPQMGHLLKELLELVLETPELNEREALLQEARRRSS